MHTRNKNIQIFYFCRIGRRRNDLKNRKTRFFSKLVEFFSPTKKNYFQNFHAELNFGPIRNIFQFSKKPGQVTNQRLWPKMTPSFMKQHQLVAPIEKKCIFCLKRFLLGGVKCKINIFKIFAIEFNGRKLYLRAVSFVYEL